MSRKFLPSIRALVGNYGGNSVTPLTFSGTWLSGTPIPISDPRIIAMVPGGMHALVASYSGGIVPLDYDSGTGLWIPGTMVSSGVGNPWGVSVTVDGLRALSANDNSDTVTPYSFNTGTQTWSAGTPIHIGISNNLMVGISVDGLHALVVSKFTQQVTPMTYNTGTGLWSLGSVISISCSSNFGLSISNDGTKAIVSGQSGNPSPLLFDSNTGLWTAQAPLPLGGCNPSAIAPDNVRALIVDPTETSVIPLLFTGGVWTSGTPVSTGASGSAYPGIIQDGIGNTAIVTNQGSGTVTPFTYSPTTGLWTAQTQLTGFNQPLGIALVPFF